MEDLASKKFLNSQSNRSNWPYIIGAAGLVALLSICGNRIMNANEEEKEFMKNLYLAPKIEYVTQKGDTLNILCSNQGLDTNQKELCKNYLVKVYPEFKKDIYRRNNIYSRCKEYE